MTANGVPGAVEGANGRSSNYAFRHNISLDTPHFFANGSIKFPQSSMAMSSSAAHSHINESIISNDLES